MITDQECLDYARDCVRLVFMAYIPESPTVDTNGYNPRVSYIRHTY
jgi:hypothetical protein